MNGHQQQLMRHVALAVMLAAAVFSAALTISGFTMPTPPTPSGDPWYTAGTQITQFAMLPNSVAPGSLMLPWALLVDIKPGPYAFTVTGLPAGVGAVLTDDPRIAKFTFTGSTAVGKMLAARCMGTVKRVSLELGGNAPFIVFDDADLDAAVAGAMASKYRNAGQTCVAPDFVLVERDARDPFVAAMKKALHEFYGDDPARCKDYGRIVNHTHFERLVNYLRDGKAVHGGRHDAKDLFIAPTLLADVSPDAAVMQEEIFGPVLPVLEFDKLDDALALLRGMPAPLALYVFTRDRATEARVLADARSGGACVNDVVSHMIGTGLPFGGLGESGMGAYHGRAGFETFSHQRAVLRRATWLDLPFRYPPQKLSLAGLKRAMRFLLGD